MQVVLIKELISIIKDKWLSLKGLFVLLALETLFLSILFWENYGKGFNKYEVIIYFIIIVATIIYWLTERRFPENKKNKIGIIVAITTESKLEYIKLKNDLILELEKTIKMKHKESLFNVIEIPEFYAAKIKDKTTSLDAMNKSRSHFIVFGACKKRMENKKNCYYIVLEAGVAHGPLPLFVSDKLEKEFSELFPRRVLFPVEEEIKGFEIARECIEVTARYIIGIALFLSGNFELSLNIFENLYKELKNIKTNIPSIQKIKDRLPMRISESALSIVKRIYYRYTKTKDVSLFRDIKYFLDLLLNFDPNNYEAHLARGMYVFLCEKNIEKAKKETGKSKNIPDASWRYSLAFLYAYEGKLDKSEKLYKKAVNRSILSEILFNIEEFINDVLEKEPEKYQLWYCLGIINWFAKNDKKLGRKMFEKFLICEDDNFYEQKRKVEEYLKEKIDNDERQ